MLIHYVPMRQKTEFIQEMNFVHGLQMHHRIPRWQGFQRMSCETSQQVVGDEQSLEGQAELLTHAISENGILTPESNMYTIYKCYDENDAFVGVELISKNQEKPLIESPKSTVRKEGFQPNIQQSSKEIDILQSKSKINLFKDIDGTIRIGSKPKLTLSKGLYGEMIVGTGIAKESVKQFDKVLNSGKTK